MDLTIFLAQVIGVYMILIGLICLSRRKMMMMAVHDMIRQRGIVYLIGILELLAGLALVISHNIWTWDYSVIITIVGWVMVIESIAYLALPARMMAKVVRFFNKKNWYTVMGLVTIVLGAYLAAVGYGLL